MAEREDSKDCQMGNAATRAGALVRKLPAARRLLVATIGAATVQFASGCGNSSVANLMAPPEAGRAGQAGRGGQGGQAGQGGLGGSAGHLISNLMAPPFIPDSGMGGRSGAGGSGGSGGAPDDMDAGMDDDAGQA